MAKMYLNEVKKEGKLRIANGTNNSRILIKKSG
jgi:hypothetical protein